MSSPRQITDVSAWVGQYPFRGIAASEVEDLIREMRGLGIGRAIVAPFEAVFWENNLDACGQWLKRLEGHKELELWPVVNPAMPGQIDEFKRLCEAHRPRGLRLTPNYHGYRLQDPCVAALMEAAAARKMVVQVFARIADERWHWMLKMPAVATDDLLYFTSVFAGQPIILSAVNSIAALIPRMRQQPRLCVDVSRVRGPVFAIEQLLKEAPPKQVLFGSLWPIQIIQSTLWQVIEARIDDSSRDALLGGNFAELLARTA